MNRVLQIVRRNRAAALVAGVILLLAGLISWNLFAPQTDPRLHAIRKQGYPATLAELNAWYAPVPPGENAALIYTNAFAQPILSEDSGPGIPMPDLGSAPPRGEDFIAETRSSFAALVTTNETALRLLHSVPAGSRSRYPLDLTQGFMTPTTHLPKVKRAVLLLSAEALLACANGGNDKAVQAFVAAGQAAESLSQEPLLISQLVRISCWNIIASRLNRAVNFTAFTDEQLARLQKMLGGAETPQALSRVLAGERAYGAAIFTDRQTQLAAFTGFSGRALTQGDRMRVQSFISLLKATGLFQKDRAAFLDITATNIAAAELPFPDRVKLGCQAGSAMPSRFCVFSRMLLPATSRAFLSDAEHTARIRAAQTALAIERFRRAHGNALPASLKELAPAYLSTVPADPYDGQPIRFKKLDAGYAIYSIGQDGRGEKALEQNAKSSKGTRGISFVVRR